MSNAVSQGYYERPYARAPIYIRKPTPEEDRRLRQLCRHPRERLRLRAATILLMADEPELCAGMAGLLAGYESRVPGAWWAKRFNEEGLAGLEDRPRPGPSKAFIEKRRRLREAREDKKKRKINPLRG